MEELRVIAFKFAPGNLVTVTYLGLNYKGKVSRCVWLGDERRAYETEYNAEGEIKCREFWEDEIEARGA